MKFKQPASRFSMVGVFVSKGPAGVRVAGTGAGACAFRARALEAALEKQWSPSACDGVASMLAVLGLGGAAAVASMSGGSSFVRNAAFADDSRPHRIFLFCVTMKFRSFSDLKHAGT
jgi:hypothetical protein